MYQYPDDDVDFEMTQRENLLTVGSYILARKLDTLTPLDIIRSGRSMRGMKRRDRDYIFAQLEAFGWIKWQPRSDAEVWVVNPEVHRLFRGPARLRQAARESEKSLPLWPDGEEGVRRAAKGRRTGGHF